MTNVTFTKQEEFIVFMRFLQLKINTEYIQMLRPFYEKSVIPELQKMEGCLFAGLIQSSRSAGEFISMTLWETKSQAEAYEKSGVFQMLLKRVKPFLSESSEWKIQLSKDLELQYEPISEEPVLKEYSVTAQTDAGNFESQENPRIYVRLVSLKIEKGKLKEFRQKYMQKIIPALRSTKGCIYAYLSESLQNKNEVMSVTIWDSKRDLDRYEESGRFIELVDKVKDTFSQFYQWKMALEKDISGRVKTSEDMKIDYYGLISGKRFK